MLTWTAFILELGSSSAICFLNKTLDSLWAFADVGTNKSYLFCYTFTIFFFRLLFTDWSLQCQSFQSVNACLVYFKITLLTE